MLLLLWVVVVLRSPIHANEPSEYNGMLYRTSNRVLNNGIKVIILICMDGTSQYHHHLTVVRSIEKSKELFWRLVANIKLRILFSNIFACKLAWRKMNIFFINVWKYFFDFFKWFLNGDVWRKFLYTINTQSAWEVTLYCGVACVLGMVKFTISAQCNYQVSREINNRQNREKPT